jgi:GR25 family glycosyltransferase involved in LPS biosynthesis
MNEYVDNVYVINMDKDAHRLQKVRTDTEKVGIAFERFVGVDVSALAQDVLDKYVRADIQQVCPDGMIGCVLSHLLVWQDAVAKNYNNVLVLEDDVCFAGDFNEEVQRVWHETPADYDILYLDYGGARCKSERDGACPEYRCIHRPSFPLFTHAMVISHRGLRKLLHVVTEIDDHIDWKIARNANKLEIYASNKQPVTQAWEDSNNSNLKAQAFPRIINHYLDKIHDTNGVPKSYGYNFQVYKYKDYIITRITYWVFDVGILASMHASILLLCLLYFACDYERFHWVVWSSGYLIGASLKAALACCVLSHCTVLSAYVLLGVLLYMLNFPFVLIKTIL